MVDRTTVDVYAMTKIHACVVRMYVRGYCGHVQYGINKPILPREHSLKLWKFEFFAGVKNQKSPKKPRP
jgi:hypothetical protein